MPPGGPASLRRAAKPPAARARGDAAGSTRALVEALHPDGAAEADGDLVVAAGSSPSAVRRAAASLAEDGIAWVRIPPGAGSRVRRRVRRAGLRDAGAWLAWPPRAPRLLLPLGAPTPALAGGVLSQSRIVRAALRGRRLLAPLLPGVGLVAQRPGARLPLAWLVETATDGPVVVAAGWHGAERGLVLHGPDRIVKTSRRSAARDLLAEAAALDELGGTARSAGARVPQVLYAGPAVRRVALAEEALRGERAAEVLRARPERLGDLLRLLCGWLERWHRLSRCRRALEPADVERFLLAPARAVAPFLDDGGAYLCRIERVADGIRGRVVPFAAAHNDLTVWNVLVDEAAIGVVDWEAAEAEAVPLVDLDYLIVDAVAAARRVPRDEAFVRCSAGGADAGLAAGLRAGTMARAGVDPDLGGLIRHVCWLGHARNEAARAGPGAARPFLAIASRLAPA